MATLNFVLSLVSVFGALFVARAYVPHIPIRENTPTAWLARAFVIASAGYFVRTCYRDVYLTMIGNPPDVALFSAALNAALIASEYCAIRARYESIPAAERSGWNVFTSPWYPSGPAIRRRR